MSFMITLLLIINLDTPGNRSMLRAWPDVGGYLAPVSKLDDVFIHGTPTMFPSLLWKHAFRYRVPNYI